MSKYDYFSWHDIKDLAMIYREEEWDDAKVTLWSPSELKEYNLCFTGSSRPNDKNKGVINFNIRPVNNNNLELSDITAEYIAQVCDSFLKDNNINIDKNDLKNYLKDNFYKPNKN